MDKRRFPGTMFRQGDATSRRRPNGGSGLNQPPLPSYFTQHGRIRNVEVARGRTGYGFTLSGQSPCVLSCILKGSPAEYVEAERHRRHHHNQRPTGIRHNSSSAMAASYLDSCSSEDELDGFYDKSANNNSHSRSGAQRSLCKPKPSSKQLGINRAEKVVAELQSGGIFNMIFENSSPELLIMPVSRWDNVRARPLLGRTVM